MFYYNEQCREQLNCLTWQRARSFSDAPMSYFSKAASFGGGIPIYPFPLSLPSFFFLHFFHLFIIFGSSAFLRLPSIQSHELKARKEAIFRKGERWTDHAARMIIAVCCGRDKKQTLRESFPGVSEHRFPSVRSFLVTFHIGQGVPSGQKLNKL